MSQVTTATLMQMKQQGEKIAVLTSYDASFTALLEAAGVEVILVGDSLGMVIQGQESTLPVDVEDMVYHTRCVARGRRDALLIADMPFMSYSSADQALGTAGHLMKDGGAHMVKLEGGGDPAGDGSSVDGEWYTGLCASWSFTPIGASAGRLPGTGPR